MNIIKKLGIDAYDRDADNAGLVLKEAFKSLPTETNLYEFCNIANGLAKLIGFDLGMSYLVLRRVTRAVGGGTMEYSKVQFLLFAVGVVKKHKLTTLADLFDMI